MSTALWALLAGAAMFGQDLLSTWLVQAESEYLPARAGVLDTLNWPMGIAVTYTTIRALAGHDLALTAAVVASVTAANFVGTSTAVRIGRRMRRPHSCPHCVVAA